MMNVHTCEGSDVESVLACLDANACVVRIDIDDELELVGPLPASSARLAIHHMQRTRGSVRVVVVGPA
jgi:hypothetical protein